MRQVTWYADRHTWYGDRWGVEVASRFIHQSSPRNSSPLTLRPERGARFGYSTHLPRTVAPSSLACRRDLLHFPSTVSPPARAAGSGRASRPQRVERARWCRASSHASPHAPPRGCHPSTGGAASSVGGTLGARRGASHRPTSPLTAGSSGRTRTLPPATLRRQGRSHHLLPRSPRPLRPPRPPRPPPPARPPRAR